MLLVQVGIVHWPGKSKVVWCVEGVSCVQVEHNVLTRLLSQLRQLRLEPDDRVLVCDVEQCGNRNILDGVIIVFRKKNTWSALRNPDS